MKRIKNIFDFLILICYNNIRKERGARIWKEQFGAIAELAA